MGPRASFVVFSDIDGLLLDRRHRSWRAARTAAALLARRHVPLVLCSDKTRAELEYVAAQLGIDCPFICERGGAVFVPAAHRLADIPGARRVERYDAVEFGMAYRHIVERLHRTARRLQIDIVGFRDMSAEDIADACGITTDEAQRAKAREYAEPFTIVGDDTPAIRERLFAALRDCDVVCRSDGWLHVAAAAVDVDVGVHLLSTMYRRAWGPITSVGFGLTMKHAPMLRAVDMPFVVGGHASSVVRELLAHVPEARVTPGSGVEGWADQIARIVESIPHYA